MKTIYVLIFLVSCSAISVAQETPYKVLSWEEAKSANPDTVYAISFAKMKLTSLPDELESYGELRSLDLAKNKLVTLPDYIGNFTHLQVLNVEKNRLENFPLEVCRLTNLETLILNRNEFERLPECISYAKELRYIDLFSNPLIMLPESIVELEHLEKIDFSGIRFSYEFQEKWTERLPDVKLVFDAPCDCMK